jgi:hypothetical protein
MGRGSASGRAGGPRRSVVGSIAVGSLAFVERIKGELGIKAVHREVERAGGTYALREQSEVYGGDLGSESEALRPQNTIFWEENAEITET